METSAPTIPVHCAYHKMVPIGDLKPNPANPNKHPAKQLDLYAAAIAAHGWRESVTVSKLSGLVVRGHGALLAARLIGAIEIPVEYQDYATAQEELADLLADNRLAHLSTTDADLLKSPASAPSAASRTTFVGEGRVVPFPRFIESLRENLHSIPPARVDHHHAAARA
jgi:hypothetical protein